jgi:hypothetical protein
MKPGDMVRNRWEGSYLPMHEKPNGIVVNQYLATEIGIVLDICYSNYSNTDVPYIQILTPGGNKGWVRYEKVEVLK